MDKKLETLSTLLLKARAVFCQANRKSKVKQALLLSHCLLLLTS